MRALFILPLLLLTSCSWRYAAIHEQVSPGREKLVFALKGYDILYGPAHGQAWAITYPTSALDRSTETLNARDFTAVEVDSKDVKDSVSGFIKMRGNSEVEARLVQTLTRPDGSRFSSEVPFNGIYRLQRQDR